MPLTWRIVPGQRLVAAAAVGRVTMGELREYYADLVQRKAMAYRELFDLSATTHLDEPEELAEIGATVRLYERLKLGPLGPLAIVATNEAARAHARLFLRATGAKRPVRIFQSVEDAVTWLMTISPR